MIKHILSVALVVSAVSALPAWSQDKPKVVASDTGEVVIGKEPGAAVAAAARVERATISAIDPATRTVTLKRVEGPDFVIRAGDAVRNFGQLKVGDQVVLRQGEALLLELKKVSDGIRERSDWVEVQRSAAGDKPGIEVKHKIQVVADVTAVNRKTGMVTLRGVRESRKFQIRDRKQLADLKVGDQVEATLIQGEALTIEARKSR